MVSVRALRFTAYGAIGVGAVLLVVIGVVGWAVAPGLIDKMVKKNVRLVDDSMIYEKWEDLPVPFYFKIWFFNLTNFEDFDLANGITDLSALPKFQEVGPYSFREYRVKWNITDGPDDTLYYRQNITYIFDPETSGPGLSENDTLTLVNIPYVTAITLLDIYDRTRLLAREALTSLTASGETLFSPGVKVQEVVFNGVELKPIYGTIESMAKLLQVPLPFEIKDGYFAIYRAKNGTNHDGEWRVYKGDEDHTKFNTIVSINDGQTELSPWWEAECAMINGTDGIMFPPLIDKDTTLYLYSSEISRSVWMKYDSETEFEGIPAWKFKLPADLFHSPVQNENNWCFFPDVLSPLNKTENFNGIGRLQSAKEHVPIVISKPHFLDADDAIVAEGIKWGLSPNRDAHDAYGDIEPHLGLPMKGHKRLQIGVEVQPYWSFDLAPFNTLPHKFYPIMWVDETGQLNEELIDEIKHKLLTPLKILTIAKWTLVGVGAFLVIAGGIYVAYSFNKKEKS